MSKLQALVGEFMVAFLLVFTVLRTAVNSDFVYSLMASSVGNTLYVCQC